MAVLGGAFAGMDALANASQSGSLTGALNAPTSALMTYQGLNPASYMNMPPKYRGPTGSRYNKMTPIGQAVYHDELQEQQTPEVEDTPDIEEHAENALIGTVGHPQEMDKIIDSAKEGHGATTPSHTPAPTETKKPTGGGLPGIVGDAEETLSIVFKVELILFPSSLKHSVPINQGDEDRISVSFNTFCIDAIGSEQSLTHLDIRRLMNEHN